jgi:hypothetical protein
LYSASGACLTVVSLASPRGWISLEARKLGEIGGQHSACGALKKDGAAILSAMSAAARDHY